MSMPGTGNRESRAKIIATIGPASRAPAMLDAMIEAGVNVARVNCAHGERSDLVDLIADVQAAGARTSRPLAVLADLAGPKLRIGRFERGAVELTTGQEFTLTTEPVIGTGAHVSVSYARLAEDVQPGAAIYLDDGSIALSVVAVSGTEIRTTVRVGGRLSDHKGLTVPSISVALPCLTEKDLADLDAVLAAGVDYVGLSFVRTQDDVSHLREKISSRAGEAAVVAKIETARAVDHIDGIVTAADAVMIARGDLGVECPIETVPGLQKSIIATCNRRGVPVITATQMLESMTTSARPTRAEVTDVANAVIDGSDALMLSAETAVGRRPAETVALMRRVVELTESMPARAQEHVEGESRERATSSDAVAQAACLAAERVGADAIVCLTQSGATARRLAKWRPRQRILGVTPRETTWRRLALVWGVQPVHASSFAADFDGACRDVLEYLRWQGELAPGARVVVTAGLPFGRQQTTNTLRVETT